MREEEVLAGPPTRGSVVRPARQTRPTGAWGSGAVRPDKASLDRAIRGPE